MKRMKFLSGLMILAIAAFVTSCTEEEPVGPSLTLDGSGDYVAADKTVETGSTFMVKITALAGDADLESLSISRVANDNPVAAYDTTLSKDSKTSFSVTLTIHAMTTEGTENFIITMKDKDGETDVKSFIITTEGAPGEINEFTAVLMGAQSASAGSTLDAETGIVYKEADRDSYQAEIDILFYYGISSGNQCTFVAPTHSTVNGVTASDFDWCKAWTTKNATKFKGNIGITTSEFDAITNDAEIKAITEINDEIITKLQADDVAAFVTAGGKKGVFKVVSITGTDGASEITINVKIQK